MIDAGKLAQEDADEYRITIADDSHWAEAIQAHDVHDGRNGDVASAVTLTMTNHDALELAAQLLIGAGVGQGDGYRDLAWQQQFSARCRQG